MLYEINYLIIWHGKVLKANYATTEKELYDKQMEELKKRKNVIKIF